MRHAVPDRHGPRVQDSPRGGCPSGRQMAAEARVSSSAAQSPETRRSRSRMAALGVRLGDAVGLGGQQPAEDQGRRQLTLGRGPGDQWTAENVCRPKIGTWGLLVAHVEVAHVEVDAVARRRSRAWRRWRRGRSRARSPARSRAWRRRWPARPSHSRGRRTNRRLASSSSMSSRHRRVVAWAPVPNACPGSMTTSSARVAGRLPRRPDGQPARRAPAGGGSCASAPPSRRRSPRWRRRRGAAGGGAQVRQRPGSSPGAP